MNKDFLLFTKGRVNQLSLSDYMKWFPKGGPGYYGDFIKAYQNPMIIEERKLNATSVDIFSRLMQNRILFLGDEIDSEVANIIQAQLLYLQAIGDEDIILYLNTPGGSVIDGLAIYDTMQFVKPDIQTVCTGMAASMGSILLVAGTKGKRKILPNGRVLIHQPWGGTMGTADDMTIEINEINKHKQRLYEILSKHTGQDVEKIKADSNRDFWLDAEEALNYGCIDEIVKGNK